MEELVDHFPSLADTRSRPCSGQPVPWAPQLPWELLERVFTVRPDPDAGPALSLHDRVRCLAVCKLWRGVLDPRRLPLHSLKLDAFDHSQAVLADWVCSTQPAVQALSLPSYDALDYQAPAVQAAHRAMLSLHPRKLELQFDCAGVLDGSMLRSLPPQLLHLDVSLADAVRITGDGLLPSLTSLDVGYTDILQVDAFLPKLRSLMLEDGKTAQLVGKQLQLPRLTWLDVGWLEGEVDLQRTPALRGLHIGGRALAPGLAALSRLTDLAFDCIMPEDLAATVEMLQQAPTTVRQLELSSVEVYLPQQRAEMAAQLGPALVRLTRLTHFVSDFTAFLPYLARLRKLRCLELKSISAATLTIEDADVLASMKGLLKLTFGRGMPKGDLRDRRLQLLASLLPQGCVVVQP